MKKIIIGILIGMVICIIGITIYIKYFMFVPDKNGMINTDGDNIEFGGYKAIEWEEMIRNFYISRLEYVPNVKCYYNETNNFIAEISTVDNIDDIYEFNPDTLIAIRDDGVAIDFINRIYLKTKISFSDNQCLAIGYVLDSNRDEFVRNNFYNDHVYSSLETLDNNDDSYCSYLFNSFEMFDYRTEESKNNGTENCFVIIPKSEEVKITLYNCFINEQGELVKLDNALIKEYTKPFIVLDDYLAETSTPELCIEFEYNGFQEIFPIVFSGMDGKLDLTGVEEEVKDISVY
ncbi:unknown [Clostridium sp. CAG:567]|jgi:hypothetical protein|nr:unknown [Clostridium sp. CAG:567]